MRGERDPIICTHLTILLLVSLPASLATSLSHSLAPCFLLVSSMKVVAVTFKWAVAQCESRKWKLTNEAARPLSLVCAYRSMSVCFYVAVCLSLYLHVLFVYVMCAACVYICVRALLCAP
jgi:hypothetical protein